MVQRPHLGIVKSGIKRYSKDVNSVNTSLVNSTFIFPTVKLRNLFLQYLLTPSLGFAIIIIKDVTIL